MILHVTKCRYYICKLIEIKSYIYLLQTCCAYNRFIAARRIRQV
jgi:hypothetical protein